MVVCGLPKAKTPVRFWYPAHYRKFSTIDFGMGMDVMVQEGNYRWVHGDITQVRELLLLHLNKEVLTEEVMVKLERRGLRLAIIEDLIAFGVNYSMFRGGYQSLDSAQFESIQMETAMSPRCK